MIFCLFLGNFFMCTAAITLLDKTSPDWAYFTSWALCAFFYLITQRLYHKNKKADENFKRNISCLR